MVDEELTNAAAISSRIWRTRTQEHSKYMSAKAAQHYIDAQYFDTNFIRTWYLPDDQWKRGLNYLIHARIGKLWTKSKGVKSHLYTLAPEFQNHCILCNQEVALDSKEELAHLIVRCPQMSTIRNSSGVEAAIHSIQDTGIWNDISDCQIYYLLCGATVSTTVLWASGGPGVNSVPFKIRIIQFLQEGLWHYYTALSRVTGLRLPDQPG